MITTEAQYQQAMIDLADLRKQYQELPAYEINRPYTGRQLARDIFKLTSDAKLYEYDRFEKSFKPVPAESGFCGSGSDQQ